MSKTKKNEAKTQALSTPPQGKSDLALPSELKGSWGADNATSEDIIIPKLLLMHGTSKLVQKGKARQGDLVISTTQSVVGGHEKAVSVVPFYMWKSYVISKKVEGKYQYAREDEYSPAATEPPWEFSDEQGNEFKREFAFNFYCLLKDTENLAPTRLQFKSTSRRAGKMIANHFAACKAQNVPPVTKAWDIASEYVEGDKNSWQAFTATQSSAKVTQEEMYEAFRWYQTVTKSDKKVIHDDGEENTETTDSDTGETKASARSTSPIGQTNAPSSFPTQPNF